VDLTDKDFMDRMVYVIIEINQHGNHFWKLKSYQVLFLTLVYSLALNCNSQKVTPNEYKYSNDVSPGIYKSDIITISDSIRNRIKSKEDPYFQTENDSLTEIIIDTILYSPKNDKFAFFAISKNSNDKLLDKGDKNEFHYAAHCFIGHLDSNFKILDIAWLRGYNLADYKTLESTSKRTNSKGESTYKYNLDDVRFWDGPLWHVYY
jgi:hypothetical protein